MAGISNDVLVQSIRDILKGADLSSLSAKKVRRKLEEKFGADLTDRKKEIDKILMKLISEEEEGSDDESGEEQQEEDRGSSDDEDDDDDDDDHKRRSKQKSARNGLSDQSADEEEKGHSDESQSDDSRPASPPPKKSKTHSKSKKEKHGKSHHKKKNDSELDDEQLAKKLQEEENNFRSRPRSVKRVPAPPKKERKPKEGKARVSIYSKPCLLSGELATVMGTDRMARKDVVKRMWEIVRERKLEDPKNKQFMLCDAQLQRVFGRKRVRTFGMMKHLKTHIKDAVD